MVRDGVTTSREKGHKHAKGKKKTIRVKDSFKLQHVRGDMRERVVIITESALPRTRSELVWRIIMVLPRALRLMYRCRLMYMMGFSST